MKVALLTLFNGLDHTYSLVNVVEDHLGMLLKANILIKLLVSEDCPDEERTCLFADHRVEWVKVTNRYQGKQIKWFDYSQPSGTVHSTFFQEVEVIAADLVRKLADVEFCFLHDIHYQGWHLVHNVALRKALESLPHLKCVAFTHSAPVNPPLHVEWPFSARYSPLPRTLFAYPTQAGLSALARQYQIPEGRCRVVNNSFDILHTLHPAVQELSHHLDLLSPDILIVYPARLTTGKRFEKVAALGGALQSSTERQVNIIFCDFPSMDTDTKLYKEKIIKTGLQNGLSHQDISFTSELGHPLGFPRAAVIDLFALSNLFVCPSYSESFGLTVLEAASRGNFLVLNEAVPALEELGKSLHAYFMRWDARNFGYDTHENYHPSETAYLISHAEKIVNLMRENQVIHAQTLTRQRYSPDWIWKNQFEPLLEMG